MRITVKRAGFAALIAGSALATAPADALVFTPGDLVVSVTGNVDGSTPGDNQAAPILLQQLTTGGQLAGSQVLPQYAGVTNGQYPISGEYGSSSEGLLHRSADSQSLVIAGYGINAGTFNAGGAAVYGNAALAQSTSLSSAANAVPRVIADITANGSVDTSTGLYNVFNTNNPRSVATVNGSSFYIAGQGASKTDTATQGVFYAIKGASSATQINGTSDFRSLSIQNGMLTASRDFNGPAGAQNTEIDHFATALPTSSSTATALPGIGPSIVLTTAGENGVNNSRLGKTVYLSPEDSVSFTDTSGNQFLYIADSGQPKNGNAGAAGEGDGGLQKWELANGATSWSLLYDISNGLNLVDNASNAPLTADTTGLIGLAAQLVGNQVELFATSEPLADLGQTYLYGISDPLDQLSLPSTERFTQLYAAPAGEIVRGVAFAPVPEPASLALLAAGLGLTGLVRRFGKRA